MVKLGLKIWSTNSEAFPKLVELHKKKEIDYIEVYTVPDSNKEDTISNISLLKDSSIILHAPNLNHGFSLRDKNAKFNESLITIRKISNLLNEKRIIFHPGLVKDEKDIEEVIENINNLKNDDDLDIILENVPRIPVKGEIKLIAAKFEDFREIIKRTGVKFCLDIGHAIYSANYYNEDPIEYIKKFLSLEPYMYHVCDGDINNKIDKHLNLLEGNFPLKEIIKLLPKDSRITLETPKSDFINLSEDIKNLKIIRELLEKGDV